MQKIIVDAAGTKRHYNSKDELHREDGPAIEYADGSKSWWINGKLHRENGPAIEFSSGGKHWYINDRHLTEEQFLQWRKDNNK